MILHNIAIINIDPTHFVAIVCRCIYTWMLDAQTEKLLIIFATFQDLVLLQKDSTWFSKNPGKQKIAGAFLFCLFTNNN